MNQEMTERIAETKELVNAAEWREIILACQESGKPVTAWCEENGISPSTYYRKLRMMREDILSGEQQIVPIKPRVPHGIRITAGEISIAMPENADPEQLAAIVGALKSCLAICLL